ncbi:PEP/pyruvate-binding domain-containing protein [Symbioplanes lichenis]|uniref:PEP/pyruvate-binding domain-containing protein n=1 Tax=Symbioplanes lichenis TaxID=1629072 RepID=UPI002738E98C|nr:PEP/pyruvate-binding domain-containing protein [Actinoplanes lichenis]
MGGKATGLARLAALGERVPEFFCVAPDDGPAAILAGYERLGSPPVAVRSSATAEDLPDAAFAGQYDTVLNVSGPEALLAAVETCRASLHSARAVAYREARDLPEGRMTVVVQRMVDAVVSGVLFTADPVTGCRTTMRSETDPLPPGLAEIGARVQAAFGCPQDIEWSVDRQGQLWLLQSRPITTLFPAPPPSAEPRVYVEFGHVQGMLRPVTPLGLSTLRDLIAGMLAPLGLRPDIVDIGGRLYGDLTDLARHPTARRRLVDLLAVDFGPRAQAAMRHVLADPRFAPRPDAPRRPPFRMPPGAITGILRALARPRDARARVRDTVERLRVASLPPSGDMSAAERLDWIHHAEDPRAGDLMWPIAAGMLASALPGKLTRGRITPAGIHATLAGMPHNVTIEMDLALWRLAAGAGEHRALLRDTEPRELADRHARGALPDFGLRGFLDTYGHRGPAEVDLGVPRWSEDPTPVFAALAGYLRVTDPEQAPDVRFARAAADAERALRAVRGPSRFLLRRARELAGLRESGKFAGLYRLWAMREQYLLIGADLAAEGLLDAAGDIVFLTPDEVRTAVHERADHRAMAAARARAHRRELRRRHVPVVLLSDGTDVEATLPAPAPPGSLVGVGASAGRASGPARVVTDPATARIEPGEVLIVSTTDPGWTPLFLTAAALVTETGAVMAHGPTVAREYGIPAVICVPDATRRIVTGDLVTVDGSAGTVSLGETLRA